MFIQSTELIILLPLAKFDIIELRNLSDKVKNAVGYIPALDILTLHRNDSEGNIVQGLAGLRHGSNSLNPTAEKLLHECIYDEIFFYACCYMHYVDKNCKSSFKISPIWEIYRDDDKSKIEGIDGCQVNLENDVHFIATHLELYPQAIKQRAAFA